MTFAVLTRSRLAHGWCNIEHEYPVLKDALDWARETHQERGAYRPSYDMIGVVEINPITGDVKTIMTKVELTKMLDDEDQAAQDAKEAEEDADREDEIYGTYAQQHSTYWGKP